MWSLEGAAKEPRGFTLRTNDPIRQHFIFDLDSMRPFFLHNNGYKEEFNFSNQAHVELLKNANKTCTSVTRLIWPGNTIPDAILERIVIREIDIAFGVVNITEAVEYVNSHLVTVAGFTMADFSDLTTDVHAIDYPFASIDHVRMWGEAVTPFKINKWRENVGLETLTSVQFIELLDRVGSVEGLQRSRRLLRLAVEDYDEPVSLVFKAEETLKNLKRLEDSAINAMGPELVDNTKWVVNGPCGPVMYVQSSDSKRLLRIPLDDIEWRPTFDLNRIAVWLETPRAFGEAVLYEEGDTHVLLWNTPTLGDGARHIPNNRFPSN